MKAHFGAKVRELTTDLEGVLCIVNGTATACGEVPTPNEFVTVDKPYVSCEKCLTALGVEIKKSGSELLVSAKTELLRRLLEKSGRESFLESLAKELLRLEGEAADIETKNNTLHIELNEVKSRLEQSERMLSMSTEAMHGCN